MAALQQRLATTETFVHQREADVRTVTAQAATIEGFLRAREADVQALQEQVATLAALRDEAESSWTWRHVRKWRRRWGWQSL